jgi:DNA-directed RNA polymerase specialized sigma24 family protein
MADAPDASPGEALFLSQLAVIERVTAYVCAQHYLAAADAEDFASHVTLKIIQDNYAVMRKFEGRSSFRTYITIVIQRLFLDYRISAWGKWRPSEEARRMGAVGLLLERLVSRDGHSFNEACELLRTNHGVTLSHADLEALAARLPVRVRRRFETEEALVHTPSAEAPPDEAVAEGERQEIGDRVSAALRRLMTGMDTQTVGPLRPLPRR